MTNGVIESPRWYIKKGNYAKAYASLCRLQRTRLQAARDLYYIHVQLFGFPGIQHSNKDHLNENHALSYLKRLSELFTNPRIRRAAIAAYVDTFSMKNLTPTDINLLGTRL